MQLLNYILPILLSITTPYSQANSRNNDNFDSYCEIVAEHFNGSGGGRPIAFEFINYRGYPQKSESIVQVIDKFCTVGVKKRYFTLRRINGGDIIFSINFEGIGNNEFQINIQNSNCAEKFPKFAAERLADTGIYMSDEIMASIAKNSQDEYCPKFTEAVSKELIEVIRGIK